MKKSTEKRGRKKLPDREKKVRVYILVKQKYAKDAQAKINRVQDEYNALAIG